MQDETGPTAPAASTAPLFDELGGFATAAQRLLGAHWRLLAAELGLARSALAWLMVAALVATVAGVALGLTLLGLLGLLLAAWFGSWIAALLLLALLQAVLLAAAVVLFRRCLRWASLPATRQEWRAMMRAAPTSDGSDKA